MTYALLAARAHKRFARQQLSNRLMFDLRTALENDDEHEVDLIRARLEHLAENPAFQRQYSDEQLIDLLTQAWAERASLSPEESQNLALLAEEIIIEATFDDEQTASYGTVRDACRLAYYEALRAQNPDLVLGHFAAKAAMACDRHHHIRHALGQYGLVPEDAGLYDIFLGRHDGDTSHAMLADLFDQAENQIPPIVRRLRRAQKQAGLPPKLVHPVSREGLNQALLILLDAIGLDINKGQMILSELSSSCASITEGWRLRVRFDPLRPWRSIQSALHEGGHALYFQNLPKAWRGQPLGWMRGRTTSEGAAFCWQFLSLHRGFWQWFAPILRNCLGINDDHDDRAVFEAESLYRHATRVNRTATRQRRLADPLSVMLHIALRTQIEAHLCITPTDAIRLPALWQEKQVKILGIKGGDDKTPAPFKASWAQDVHWFKQHIMFGYFPHYATGLMFGAAMIQRYGQGLGDQETPDQEWRNGDFGPYRRWLCTHFYGYGARQSAQEIAGPLNLGAYSDFIERQATWT